MCVFVCVSIFLLVQAIYDFAYKEQGFLSLHTWVSGMLERCLDHFSGFLVHCQQHTNADIWSKTLKHSYGIQMGKHKHTATGNKVRTKSKTSIDSTDFENHLH